MIIVLQVDAPLFMAQGIKESLAMDLEKYGDVKVLEVRPERMEQIEQMRIADWRMTQWKI